MTWRAFAIGVLIGLLLIPLSNRVIWQRARDTLAHLIDAVLRIGMPTAD